MKNTLFFLILLCLACQKDKDSSPKDSMTIMDDCYSKAYQDSSTIAANLIGNWTLIDYNCGLCPPPVVVPEASVVFSNGSGTLTFKENPSDPISKLNFTWSLERIPLSSDPSSLFRLETDPTDVLLTAEVFCEDFLFVNQTAFDGVLLLYEKD